MSPPLFTFEEVSATCNAAFDRLKDDLPEDILARLTFGRKLQHHGTDSRVFQYHFWDKKQPQLLNRQHLSYGVAYDPVSRYHHTLNDAGIYCPFYTRFYMNKRRGVYEDAEIIVPSLYEEMQKAQKALFGFRARQNKQSMSVVHAFVAYTLEEAEEEIYQSFLELVPYWHGVYAAYCDQYGTDLTKDRVRAIIAQREKFSPSGPKGRNSQEYSRNIPIRLRERVYERDGHACLKCGSTENLHADHINPVAQGGLTKIDNLQTLCAACNLSKGGLETIDYRK